MTRPTPLSTAGSAEDLAERLRNCTPWMLPDATKRLCMEAADEIERLRQPVAGDTSDLVKALESPTVEQTIEFIKKAHAGQTDKLGREYWLHPVAVMNMVENASEHEKLVALLHDVLEDTETKPADLLKMGYSFDVVWDANTITKRGNTAYQTWIETISYLGSESAIKVKIADLEHNLSPERLHKLPEKDRPRLALKYRTAWLTLTDALNRHRQGEK